MQRYIVRRLTQGVITLAIVVVAVFFLFQVIGDPARRSLPLNSTEQQIEEYRQATGLADPLMERLTRYLVGVVQLDFGTSTTRGTPAMSAALDAVPRSLALAAVSFVFMVGGGLVLGIAAGINPDSRTDRSVQAIGAIAASIPEFWSGLVLILFLAVYLGLFPTGGYGGLHYAILPALAMAIPPMGRLIFVVRESVRAVLREPYILVARSKGLPARKLISNHILRAAMVPIVSIGGLELTRMAIGGVVVIESVFAWPGIGRLYVEAMDRFDLPLISATLFCATTIVLIMNILIDILYVWIDPRVDLASA
ncbi:MAG TPA: ABC transporter permease [Rhizobiaceae bacterium]|nr:ABC transporter permease [Rhizobiaceae bacterium]